MSFKIELDLTKIANQITELPTQTLEEIEVMLRAELTERTLPAETTGDEEDSEQSEESMGSNSTAEG